MSEAMELLLLEEINCCVCGIRFGVAEALLSARKRDYFNFYCPNGHGQSYTKPKPPRDEEMDSLKAAAMDSANDAREARDELAAAKARIDQLEAGCRRCRRKRAPGAPA